MKILHVLDHSIPLHSGYTFRTRAILQEQRRRGWKTAHLTGPKHDARGAAEEEVDGLRFYRTPIPTGWLTKVPIGRELAFIDATTRRLREAIAIERPDILHAHSPALNGVAAIRAGRAARLPVVYEIRAFWEDAAVDHGTSSEWGLRYRATRAMETWVINRAAAITTICEGLRAEICGRGVAAQRVTVIPNAVDAERFAFQRPPNAELAARLGLDGKRIAGFIGSFYGYEGLSLLVDALASVQTELPDLRLLLVGGGPQEANLKAQVARLGLGHKVCFTGRVPHAQVDDYYDLVDVFVYPRLPMRLTDLVTPLKPLEAMAQGKLVLASDVGGHRELIRDGENGFLFQAGDTAALAAALREVFAQQQRWPQVHAAGRRFVEAERTWPLSVARYEDVYAAVLGKRHG